MMDVQSLQEYAKKIEASLETYLQVSKEDYGKINDAMRYATLGGGKRIRGALVLAFAHLLGGEEQAALPLACAVEMVHAYSLVHDDLPCMDDDDLRRGKPSCHIAYGEWMALLAGDGLLTEAFEVIGETSVLDADQKSKAVLCLAKAAGSDGMIAGQVLDLTPVPDFETVQEQVRWIKNINDRKTGALIMAAAQLGCIAAKAGEDEMRKAIQYAGLIGQAFQIADDLLDIEGDPALLGKPVGSDADNHKKNYVVVFGKEKAKEYIDALTNQAQQSLVGLPGDTTFLKDLAVFLANRKK